MSKPVPAFTSGLERAHHLREDAGWLAARRGDETTAWILLQNDKVLVQPLDGDWTPLLQGAPRSTVLSQITPQSLQAFIGLSPQGNAIFAATLAQPYDAAVLGCELVDLRSFALRHTENDWIQAATATARSVIGWLDAHRHCGHCGTKVEVRLGGWRTACPNCGATAHPRIDPSVIMLVKNGDSCILARKSSMPPGLYTVLAGFVEPGETIEVAVQREVTEEVGVTCNRVSYIASQPWPFWSTLMIACIAETMERELTVDKTELEHARWATRDEVRKLLLGQASDGMKAPPAFAVSRVLLQAFVDGA